VHNPDRTRPAVADEFDLDLRTRRQRQPITDRLGNDDPPRAIDGSFHGVMALLCHRDLVAVPLLGILERKAWNRTAGLVLDLDADAAGRRRRHRRRSAVASSGCRRCFR
jgi:hypothetical protein